MKTKQDIDDAKEALKQWLVLKKMTNLNNKLLLAAINHNIKEIRKFIKGEKNEWE